MSNVEQMKTPAVRAKEYQQEVASLLAAVAAVMDRAHQDGMTVQFQMGINNYGRNAATAVTVIQVLA